MTNAATRAQNEAADPNFSTWLSANAGSGKTRVLTDRVARMLLHGAPPQNILCLTYTKAAAGEMQNRLLKRLGAWAMLDDEALRTQLAVLGETDVGDLDHARTLFARAIETPGGLKIQTIHSFCSTLLRQFPLEAGVSPQFTELDDAGALELIDGVLDELALRDDPSLTGIAEIYSGRSLSGLARSIASKKDNFAERLSREEIFRSFGLRPEITEADILRQCLTPDDLGFLCSVAPALAACNASKDRDLAEKLSGLAREPDLAVLKQLEEALLTGSETKNPFTPKKYPPTKSAREGAFSSHVQRFDRIRHAIADMRSTRVAFIAARNTAALHAFAAAFLPAYRAAKEARAVLDFDDLIDLARHLLTDRSLAWVLYRLDGGIDHILVDEAQDTSPAQWQVVAALAAEITAGQGSRPNVPRSLFVVGDKKQSIYSFQGANARAFDSMAEQFGRLLADQAGMKTKELEHSFRSSSAILTAIDAVLRENAAEALGADFEHIAFHEDSPGRVDIWPLVERPEKLVEPAWYDPVDRPVANAPPVVLAERIAERIAEMIESETIPDKNGCFRPVVPGDFLILVQARSELFDQIIRACKARNLPMAGADRLKVSGELAVRDLLALMSFLVLPEDDLSLAAALRSPLFGWTEAELYNLAQGRKAPFLWAELRSRQDEYPQTVPILRDLRDKADYLRPYELLEFILIRHDGRRRLLSRLGPEAEDGIDELLNQALAYEQSEIPSLTGFLVRAKAENIEIKRQTDNTGGLIRVMTVHGAKGLEAPIVILPDTSRVESNRSDDLLMDEDGIPLWPLSRPESPDRLHAAKDAKATADREERLRVLYVAMTRAEQWLIVCGTERGDNKKDATWHDLIRQGLERAGATEFDAPTGPGLRLQHGIWREPGANKLAPCVSDAATFPTFFNRDPKCPPEVLAQISPSGLGGAKIVTGATEGLDEASALLRGSQLHLLLEHLPTLPPETRADAARNLLMRARPETEADTIEALTVEALTVIDAFPEIFDVEALTEVELTAHLPTLTRDMRGTVDRLIVTPERVVAVDFKTNALAPERPEDTPDGILRQMGAYLEALEKVWPDRVIEIAVLWTASSTIMPLEHGIVRQALATSTTS